MKKKFILVLLCAVLGLGIYVLFYTFEGKQPVIDIDLPSVYLKKSYEMTFDVKDQQTGLRKVMVSIIQQNKEKVLLEKKYKNSMFSGLFSDSKIIKDAFTIPVQSRKYGMTDGEAVIRVEASDSSWRGWNKGNIALVEKKVIIDSKPPKISVLTKQHNIERGGAGLVIYKLFEKNIKSGVKVGDNFFPGHSGLFENKNIHAAFFALSYRQGPGTQIAVIAEDMAANITKRGFYHYIRDQRFKTDTLNISDRFLDKKMAEFDLGAKNDAFLKTENPMLEKFLYINGKIRTKNSETILSVPLDTDNTKQWNGSFSRLEGSARRAGFGDHRAYKYKGKKIDKAVHLGIDLASIANSPVKAANSGRIIFAKFVGIFGNTIIIDHGFGLCSLYSHLSQFSVNRADSINKGDVIGFTGSTGLAGGDHLHFSMIVHNVFVNPVEWWDGSWIKNNITSKIDFVKQMPQE